MDATARPLAQTSQGFRRGAGPTLGDAPVADVAQSRAPCPPGSAQALAWLAEQCVRPADGSPAGSCSRPMLAQTFSQCVNGAEVVGLHTAFGTAYRGGGLRHIQFFPGSEQKRLLLPERQASERRFKGCASALLLEPLIQCRGSRIGDGLAGVVLVVVAGVPAEPLAPPIPHPRAGVPVSNLTLQDAREERPSF